MPGQSDFWGLMRHLCESRLIRIRACFRRLPLRPNAPFAPTEAG